MFMRHVKLSLKQNIEFYRSALNLKGEYTSIQETIDWISELNRNISVKVEKKSLSGLKSWTYNDSQISHESGKFFSIIGFNITHYNNNQTNSWEQPIINQPEIGILGFIVKKINGIYHFLVQAKIEPGNVNKVQLSPTLQATKSNYSRVHKGKTPKYLNYFLNPSKDSVIIDQLQSEQGSRFFKKRNRNMIVEIKDDFDIEENYSWLTLGQLKYLMTIDNIVNMDSRTVTSHLLNGIENNISGLDIENQTNVDKRILKSLDSSSYTFNSYSQLHSFMSHAKSTFAIDYKPKDLKELENWYVNENLIRHSSGQYFSIIGVNVSIENREVVHWDQPMIEPSSHGTCILFSAELEGVLHLLIRRRFEFGLKDYYEFGPTIQTSHSLDSQEFKSLPFAKFYLSTTSNNIFYDSLQSEEGGRFYREQNRTILTLNNNILKEDIPEDFTWITLAQLNHFIQFSGMVNIQLRNMFSQIQLIHG